MSSWLLPCGITIIVFQRLKALQHYSYLCFICTISSLLRPRILSCLLRSLTERVTRSSSVIPHCNEALETSDQSHEYNGVTSDECSVRDWGKTL